MQIFHVLANTDSTSLKFIFISDPNSETPEDKFRDIIFEVIIASEIYKRFDSSHEFWDIFGTRKEQTRKKLGYYETRNINNPCILTMTINLKEYLELVKDRYLNNKQKSIKKVSSLLGFENFAQRIKSLVNFDTFKEPQSDQKQVLRLTALAAEMVKNLSQKANSLNIMITSFGHPNLNEIDEFKQKKGKKIEKYFRKEKEYLFNFNFNVCSKTF